MPDQAASVPADAGWRMQAVTRRRVLLGGAAVGLTGAGAAYAGLRKTGTMTEYGDSIAQTRAVLSEQPGMQDLVRYATLAPSGHNTQPWRFQLRTGQVTILQDLSRRTPVVDPDDHHLFVGLGCAAENLALAAAARGMPGEASFSRDHGGSVIFNYRDGPAAASELFDAIPHRQSTRADCDCRPAGRDGLNALAAAAAVPGVELILITDPSGIAQVRDLVIAGNSAQMADPAFVRELKAWLRYSPRQAATDGDGLFTATTGNPVLPAWLGPALFDLTVSAAGENDKYARQLASSSGVAVFVSDQADAEHWVRAGRACQRFALQATALGLKVAFMNQPVEVPSLRSGLADLVGRPGQRPDIVMRFGYGPVLPFSARRPVPAVLA